MREHKRSRQENTKWRAKYLNSDTELVLHNCYQPQHSELNCLDEILLLGHILNFYYCIMYIYLGDQMWTSTCIGFPVPYVCRKAARLITASRIHGRRTPTSRHVAMIQNEVFRLVGERDLRSPLLYPFWLLLMSSMSRVKALSASPYLIFMYASSSGSCTAVITSNCGSLQSSSCQIIEPCKEGEQATNERIAITLQILTSI